jgi:hypothetical protein
MNGGGTSLLDFQPEITVPPGGAQTPGAGANPNPGLAANPTPPPASAPATAGSVSRRAVPASGIQFQAEESAPPAPIEPGGFGPWHPSEAKLFSSPAKKGLHEGIALGFGLKAPNEPIGDALADVWDNLVSGAQQSYQRIHETMGGAQESGVSGMVGTGIDLALTPLEMIAQGIEGTAHLFKEGSAQMWEARRALESGARTPELDQQFSRGAGMVLAALGQLAMSGEGEKVGRAAGERAGAVAAERAPAPGNALVRANRERNYMFGKNPGRVLVDEPIHPTFSLENLRAQVQAAGDRLHDAVQQKLMDADSVRTVQPNGTIARVPNLLDHVSEVEAASKEALDRLAKDKGVTNRPAIAKAVGDLRDDILQEHDPQGQPIQGPPQLKTPSEVNELKKKLGGKADWTRYESKAEMDKAAVLNDFVRDVYRRLNDLTDNAVGGQPGERIRDLNRQYANVIEFRELLDKRIALERGSGGVAKLLRKGEWGSGVGMILSGNPAAQVSGAALIANRLARTTPGRILRARAMAAAPKVLPAAGSAAGVAAGSIPAISGAAARTLSGEP